MTVRSLHLGLTVAFVALAAVVLVLFRPLAVELVYPVERLKHWIGNCVSSDTSEVRRLRQQVASLSIVQQQLLASEAENDRLRQALSFDLANHGVYVPGEILSEGGGASAVRRTLRVGAGSLLGVKEGAPVVVPEGLVGRVTSVTPHTCEVTLITDPSVHVAAAVELPQGGKAYGLTAGGSQDFILLQYLKEYRGRLPVHSRVLTSGRGGVFPAGLEIGSSLVQSGEDEDTVDGLLPSVDFESLKEVFIRRDR